MSEEPTSAESPVQGASEPPPRLSHRARIVGWSLALGGTAVLVLASVFILRWFVRGEHPPYLDESRPPPTEIKPKPKPSNLLRLAGSGSNLPLTRDLADAFVATRPWLRVQVHESIGSGGGVLATRDRAIEVGLISRPLSEKERELGLISIPYARGAVVFAANPSVPVRSLAREEVLALYGRRQTHWSDNSPVYVLQREAGDSSHQVAADQIEGFAVVDERARAEDSWRILHNDRAMQEALISTPGAIGLFDLGLIVLQELPIVVLEYEDQWPNEAAVRSGAYPLVKDLSFVVVEDQPDALALEFVAFVFSQDGQRIINESGYVALDPPEHSAFAHLRAVGPPEP